MKMIRYDTIEEFNVSWVWSA